jgi:hypothetical protein
VGREGLVWREEKGEKKKKGKLSHMCCARALSRFVSFSYRHWVGLSEYLCVFFFFFFFGGFSWSIESWYAATILVWGLCGGVCVEGWQKQAWEKNLSS